MERSEILSGIKVVELASVLAGPSVGMFLAELGADVTKIENPGTGGDTTRQWKTPKEDSQAPISAYYASANWGKSVVRLDLKNPVDRQAILKLVSDADIVLINFKPGDAEKYGLDHSSLKNLNPALILGEITGFSDSDRPAFDIVLQAESGLLRLNGHEGSAGMKWPLPIVDILAAHQLKEGILLALYQRTKSGKGAHVSVSLFDAAVASLFNVGTNVLMGGMDPRSLGALHPNIAPYGEILTSSDGQSVVLAVGTDGQFSALCGFLGASQGFMNGFSTNRERLQNREKLGKELQQRALQFSFDELVNGLIQRKIPFGRIRTVKEALDRLPSTSFLNEKTEGVDTIRLRSAIFKIRS